MSTRIVNTLIDTVAIVVVFVAYVLTLPVHSFVARLWK